MIDAVQFLWPPFFVAVCLVGIHAYFGIQVLARKVIFVDLALAQIAALGATYATTLGYDANTAGDDLVVALFSLAFATFWLWLIEVLPLLPPTLPPTP